MSTGQTNDYPSVKIDIRKLSYSYVGAKRSRSEDLFDRFSLELFEGETTALLGPSGCGKTTLLKLICRLLSPDGGQIVIAGGTDGHHAVSFVDQDCTLLPNMTVFENVELPLRIAGHRDSSAVLETLQLVGMAPHVQLYPKQLSGGMKQRVALARALVTKPSTLILDEPFSTLDPVLREQVCDDFLDLASSLGQTAVLVTHSLEDAVFLADRVIVLFGRPVRVASTIDVRTLRAMGREKRYSQEYFEAMVQIRRVLEAL